MKILLSKKSLFFFLKEKNNIKNYLIFCSLFVDILKTLLLNINFKSVVKETVKILKKVQRPTDEILNAKATHVLKKTGTNINESN